MLSDFNAQFSAKQFPQHKQINLAEPGRAQFAFLQLDSVLVSTRLQPGVGVRDEWKRFQPFFA
jgi:hypothetical protein